MNVLLVIQSGSKRRQTFRMNQNELIIGRRSGSNIRIPSSEVSRQHCRLFKDDGVLMVEDLNSINGTTLNEYAISRPEIVRPGDVVQIGPVEFLVQYKLSAEAEERINGAGPEESVEMLMEVDEQTNNYRPRRSDEMELVEVIEDDDEALLELEPIEVLEDELEPLEDFEPIEDVDEADFLKMEDESAPLEDSGEEDWSLPLDLEEPASGGSPSGGDEDEDALPMDQDEEDAFRDFLDDFDEH